MIVYKVSFAQKGFLLLFFLQLAIFGISQDYSRARIFYNTPKDLILLGAQGVPLDHCRHKKNVFLESDFSEKELTKAKALGLKVEVLIPDVVKFYREQNIPTNSRNYQSNLRQTSDCFPKEVEIEHPVNWKHGSMGGFFTYEEFLAELDLMAQKYPNLITAKAPISTFKTFQDRPIHFVKISDNPSEQENEPEVLYTAIHHAREPAALSQLIFFMWDLLENYDTSDEIKALVNNTQMFFVPLLNPDGYVHNQKTEPNGGGMWRKNRRGGFGVDNNRNYAYKWGGEGASSSKSDDTYRGEAAFSEAENQSIKWLCEQHNFRIALNAHTYDESILFPFGYDEVKTEDHDYLQALGNAMVNSSGYRCYQSAGMYPAAGDSDDWMYAGASKPKIFAYTPELGYAFWPAKSDIDKICKEMYNSNRVAAWGLLNFATFENKSSSIAEELSMFFKYEVQRLGLEDGKDFKVSISPIGSFVTAVGSQKVHSDLQLMETKLDSIRYELDPEIQLGDEFQLELRLDNGYYVLRDTITMMFGAENVLVSESGDNADNISGWGITTEDYYSPPSCFTDSPDSNYSTNESNEMLLLSDIVLSSAIAPTLTFWTKWDIEKNYDYVQVLARVKGESAWEPLCGKFSVEGGDYQEKGQPLYHGSQTDWVQESIDLSKYIGQTINIKFGLNSDEYSVEDGFYVDDLTITVASVTNIVERGMLDVNCWPNPANDEVVFDFGGIVKGFGKLKIYSQLGSLQDVVRVSNFHERLHYPTSRIVDGVYYCIIKSEQYQSLPIRLVVAH